MGIQGLLVFIKKKVPEAVTPVKLADLHDKKIGFDASIFIYQYCMAVPSVPAVTLAVQGVFFLNAKLLQAGVHPIWVFDGKPGGAKDEIIRLRSLNKGYRVPAEVFSVIRRLLGLMNVQVVEAPSEADSQLAAMIKRGSIDIVATDDLDALPHGCSSVLMKLTGSPILVDLAKILTGLGLTQRQFIEFCVLCGCDYSQRVPGVGPAKALKLIKDYNIAELVDMKKIPPREQYTVAIDEFIKPNVKSVRVCPQALMTRDQIAQLRQFLLEYKCSESRIANTIANLSAHLA